KASGVPLGTVQKIFSGLTRSPRKFTIQAIEKALAREEGAKAADLPDTTAYNAVPQDSRYTIDDYYSISEDRRIELIDGVIYDMAAPSSVHQQILGDLHILFRECSDRHGMPCEVFLSPFDVRLDKDNYTMVQPDLLVICGEYDVEHGIRFEGAPDLVIEILSPSTRSKDQLLKLVKYENAGVREYWIVDPKYRTVTVHCFREEEYTPRKYEFESQIPVGISNGTCTIDFSRVGKRPFR
ncbi:MAG: Uma2 family endonuclease, partial [Lachnospiraceae bacterium]|nr:Uma2 family endonuclease [Lachnospiraceae bacterium]